MQPAGAEDAELWREREIGADIYGISFECGKCLLIFFFLIKSSNPHIHICFVEKRLQKGREDPPQALKTCLYCWFLFYICFVGDKNDAFLPYSPSLLPCILSSVVIPTVSSVKL